MPFPRHTLATTISDRLHVLAGQLKTRSRASFIDANHSLESVMARFFNALFGWSLVNLNAEQANFPAADLGDRELRIAVQITNESSSDKIKTTASKAVEHQLGADFDQLIIFFLLPRKPGMPRNFEQPSNGPQIECWDLVDLLNKLKNTDDLGALGKASKVLDDEMSLSEPQFEGLKAQQQKLQRTRRRIAIGIAALLIVLAGIAWGTNYIIEQNRQLKEASDRDRIAREKEHEENVDARKALDDIRDRLTLAPSGKSDLKPKERYENALEEVAFTNKMDKAQLLELIGKFTAKVETDPQATLADKARVAFDKQQYAEAARLGNEAGDNAVAKMQSADAEREEQRRAAIENYTISGQAEGVQAHYDAALAAFEKVAALTDKARDPVGWADANIWVASVLDHKADHARAIALLEEIVPVYETHLGPEDPKLATTLNNLAQLFQATNRLAEAEPLMKRALAVDETSLGPDHPNFAIDLNNLASLFQATKRMEEAEPLRKRVATIFEKTYGPDHPNFATALNNLAQLYQATNRLAEAEPLMKHAIAIDVKSLGPDHPDVARDLNNLAGLYLATNRLAEAEPLFKRALAIDEKKLGPDHPDVAIRLNNLALLYLAANRLAEAEPLFKCALTIDEKSLGADHPNVAIRLNNLASLYVDTNRLSEAEPPSRLALGILGKFQRSTGHEHPEFKKHRTNYANIMKALGLIGPQIEKRIAAVVNGEEVEPVKAKP